MPEKTLHRDSKNQMIGGVAAGIAEYFELDVSVVRLITLILVIFTGVGLVVYIIAWIVIPAKPGKNNKSADKEISDKAEEIAGEVRKAVKTNKAFSGKEFWGVLILIIGLLLVIQNLLGFGFWRNFWPVILIIIGLYLILRSSDN